MLVVKTSKVKNRCDVCGRVFPDGQGIILTAGDEVVILHSKRCAVKFLRAIIDRLDPTVSKDVIRRVKKDFDEILRKHSLSTSKKI